MKKLVSFLMLIFIFLFNNVYVANASVNTPPNVVADGAILIDSSSGKILYEKNKDTVFFPASTTKIMTALLVLENCKLDDKVIVGKKPSSFVDGNKIYIYQDEEFTVDQLLHALLIASANDVAIALAEHVAGTEEAFADMMNVRAKALGCTNTHFVNSHGLDDPNHYTTARDLSLIAAEAMKYETFRNIVSTISFSMTPTNKQPLPRPLYTNNQLFLSKRYKVEGANGMKVGYTDIAGHSFVGSAYHGDTKLIVVLLHDKKPGMWEDASQLLNYGFDNYKTEKVVSSGSIISSLKIGNDNMPLQLAAKNDLYCTYPINEALNLNKSMVITDDGKGSISKGQKMGYMVYKDSDTTVGKVELLSSSNLIPSVFYNYTGVKNETIRKSLKPSVVIVSIVSLLFFAAFARILHVKRMRAIRRKKISVKSNKGIYR